MSNAHLPCSGAVIVGATCPLEMDAEFSTGRAVYESGDGNFLIHRSTSADGATLGGDLLAPDEWTALVDAEEALGVTPTPVQRPVQVWVFRSSKRDHWWMTHLEQLQQIGALAYQEPPRQPRSTRICLVYSSIVGTARDLWAQRSSDEAWRSLLEGDRSGALRHARRAFCLAPRLYPRDAAMLALTYSRAGKNEDGEGVLAMVRRSKDEAFYQAVLDRRQRLADDLQAIPLRPSRARTREAASRRAFDESRTAGLKAWSSDHETPSA